MGEKGGSDGDSARLLGDASGCSFDGGSESNLSDGSRLPVSKGIFDDCSRRKSAARPSGKRDRSESAPSGSHFEKTSLVTLSTGIGPRGYARRNLGLRTVPPMSTTYHPHITPPLGGGPYFSDAFLRPKLILS